MKAKTIDEALAIIGERVRAALGDDWARDFDVYGSACLRLTVVDGEPVMVRVPPEEFLSQVREAGDAEG